LEGCDANRIREILGRQLARLQDFGLASWTSVCVCMSVFTRECVCMNACFTSGYVYMFLSIYSWCDSLASRTSVLKCVCMSVFAREYVCMSVFARNYVCVHICHLCSQVCVYVSVCKRVCVCVSVCERECVYVYMPSVLTRVCMSVFARVCVCMCTCIPSEYMYMILCMS